MNKNVTILISSAVAALAGQPEAKQAARATVGPDLVAEMRWLPRDLVWGFEQ